MKIAILDADTLGSDLDLSIFSKFGTILQYPTTDSRSVVKHAKNCEILIVNKVRLSEEILAQLPDLQLICVAATGYDPIDISYCRTHGIAVANVPSYSTQSVAQWTFSVVLALAMHLNAYCQYVKSGTYSGSAVANHLSPCYHELAGQTWGVIGYGGIGQQVAKVASAMGCQVLVHKRTPISDVKCVDLMTLCKMSDIITIHVPLTKSTRGMIGQSQLAAMKKTVILVNAARGLVLEEAAVAQSILDEKIGAFGCDVYSQEPFPVNHPYTRILPFPNVLLTPHMAWGAYEARRRRIQVIGENIQAFFAGTICNRIV